METNSVPHQSLLNLLVSPGKGKTPLRRSNNVSVSVDQTKVKVPESTCEKSCQVSSEQIKADMKAAAENSRRTISKGITIETGETTARPGADGNCTVQSFGSTGAEGRTGMAGSGGRTGPRGVMSRQVGGCGRVVAETSYRAATTTDRATGPGWTNDGAERGTSCTVDGRVRQGSGPAVVDNPEPKGATVNCAPRVPTLLARQGDRQPISAAGSGPQQGRVTDEDFVPRRPLTRSCTRMSSVPLVPETGKT